MAYNIRFAYVDTEAEYNAMVEDGNINENYFYYVKDTGATYRGTTPLTDSVIVIEDVKTIPENPVANRFYIDMNGGLAILLDNHWVVVNDPEVKAVNFVDDASEQPSGAEEGVLYFDGSNLGTLVGANWMMLNDLAVSGLTLVNDVTTTPSELTDNHLYADLQGGLAFAARKDDDTVVYTLLIDPTYKSLQQVATVAVAPDGARFGTLYCDPEGHLAYMSRVADDNGNYPWIQVQAKEAEYAYKAFQIASLLTVERGKKYDYGNVRLAEEIPSGMFLTCVGSGVSADATPDSLNKKVKAGEVVEDGTVKWKICKFASTEDVANLQKVPEAEHAVTADKATDADKLDGIPANLYATKADYADYTDNFQRIDDKVVALTEKVDAFDETYVNNEKLNGYLQQATEAYTALTNRDDELKSDIDTKANKADFDNAIKQATTVYNQLTAKDKELQANIDKKVDTTTYQTAIDELDDRVTTLNASVADVIDSNTEINASLENKVDKDEYNQAIQQATTTITSMLTDITNLKNTDSQFEDAYNQFNASVTQQFQEINTKHDDLANKVNDNYNGQQTNINDLNSRMDNTVHRVDQLESDYKGAVEGFNGFSASVTQQFQEINTKHDDLANKVQDNWNGHQEAIVNTNTRLDQTVSRVDNLETQGSQALQQVQSELQKLTQADQDLTELINNKINALIWRPAVDDQIALVAIPAPQEGWTVSLKDTNKVYRFDADYVGDFDSTHIAAGDSTPGAWVELGHTIYSLATQTSDGLMSATDKKTLDDVVNTYETKADATLKQQTLQGNIDTLEGTVDDLNSNVEQYHQTTTDSIDELRGTVNDLNENVEKYNQTHTQEINELRTSVGNLNTNLESYNSTMTSEFEEVRGNIGDVQDNLDSFIKTIQGEDGSSGELAEIRQNITAVQGNLDSHISDANGKFVLKEGDKVLSTNDFTDELQTKLNGIEDKAQVNKIESIKVNGEGIEIGPDDKSVNISVPIKVSQLQNDSNYAIATEGKVEAAKAADKLAKAVTINGVAFDGSQNITIEDNTKVATTQKAIANGIATLDGNVKVPVDQLPVAKADVVGVVKVAADSNIKLGEDGAISVDPFYTQSAADEKFATKQAVESSVTTINESIETAKQQANSYADSLNSAMNTRVTLVEGRFDESGAANKANELVGFNKDDYLTTANASTTYVTNTSLDNELAAYAKSTEVSSQIAGAINGLQWKTSVVGVAALKAITTPKEGWTVSVDDTNAIYRYDAQSEEAGDDDKFVKATDGTPGVWVKLSTSFYSVATQSTDGLMSSVDKVKLDAFTNASDYLKSVDASTMYLGIHAVADDAAKLNNQDASFYATASALNNEVSARAATDGKVAVLEGYFAEGGAAKKANELVGFNPADYSTTTDVEGKITTATTDMATKTYVATALEPYAKTEAMTTALGNKVDKVEGKQLSTEDFTTELKGIVEGIDTIYATKTELSNKADASLLAEYVQNDALNTAISDMATKTYVADTYQVKDDYATTEAMNKAISTATTDMATKTYVATALEPYAKTEAMTTALADKVDVVAGKQLSTEDFTSAYKATLDDLGNTYATKAEVSNKADASVLDEYVKTDAIADMATNDSVATALKPYAKTEDVAGTYATQESVTTGLAAKADATALADYATNDDLDSTNVVLNTVDGTVVALQEQIALLKQQIQNLKTPDVETVTVEADVTQEDKDVKVVAAEVADTTRTVKAKSIQVEDYKATNSRTVLSAANDVTINNLTTSGDLPKSTSNAGMSIYSNADVVINSGDWNQTGYNAIEIGLNSDSAPKNVLIDGIDFNAKMSNNAILVFAHQANATITISNCHFADVSNCVRISNRLNVPAKIKFINCTCDAWESRPGYELYPGFLILEDYTSKNETEFKEQNRFAKLDIEFINCYGPHGKLEGDASTLSVPGQEQAVYICVDNWNSKVLTYAGNEQYFPKISAI